MNVPHTPGSKLRQMLTEMERGLRINSQVKYSEELGSTLEDLLVRDPWSEVGCGRVDCFPCKSKKGNCQKQGITYRIDCVTCKAQGKEVTYFGESARTAYDRGLDHLKAIERGDISNACAKHHMESHQGEPWDFKMSVIRCHKYPLQRQSHEGRLIEDFKGQEVMNQKGEWGCNLPPKLQTDSQPVSQNAKRVRQLEAKTGNLDAESSYPHLERE